MELVSSSRHYSPEVAISFGNMWNVSWEVQPVEGKQFYLRIASLFAVTHRQSQFLWNYVMVMLNVYRREGQGYFAH